MPQKTAGSLKNHINRSDSIVCPYEKHQAYIKDTNLKV